ncbi:hypothetical protein L2E82_38169 [Cichorium intybus]|uniref:Uncharacterized protein n=1 Tax=Cichorium intybus TaxID=13427 RepID=A0ACB9AF25_CICIN|nr:hypothetical protein L2E82_38169 [Cichorium intybus]
MMSDQEETEDKHAVSTETENENIDVDPTKTRTEDIHVTIPTETEVKGEDKNKIIRNKKLRKAIVEGRWHVVTSILMYGDKSGFTEAINSDGNTLLHIVVGISRNDFVRKTLYEIKDEQLPKMINSDGSTALHIAAIVGNTEAAELLIHNNRSLLGIPNHKGETPLDKAYENMHFDTIEYLLKAVNDDAKTKKKSSVLEASVSGGIKGGVNLLVNAISAKQYDLATDLVKKFPEFAVENDNALMALARTFPNELDYGETLIYPIYPSIGDIWEGIAEATKEAFLLRLRGLGGLIYGSIFRYRLPAMLLGVPLMMLIWTLKMIYFLIISVLILFRMFYFLSWKVATRVVGPLKHIEKKKKKWEEAKEVLKLVCDEVEKLEVHDAHPRYYTGPVLEAARQNGYEVVAEILKRSPEAIRYKDKSGYDIIQLAVLHRSENIYNLIYIIGERKSIYRTIEDSSKNNMLHLAGRLAPSQKLKCSTGAAFQLQRELQWREEVEKLVFPAYITKENIFMETPDMVFTKEHENLVKEGEKWMKAVAESCSITAALITTIVFAAAITVPGGSNQETGIPLFTEDIAFTIFAVSDAISLFASSTALLLFLSILTGRFAEQDFLVSLPRRLIIGLCTLMLSTTAMMVAFGATLFLVFCHRKPWMLAPICVLAFLPIASFGTLQIPLIVDLFRSTYVRIFGDQTKYSTNRFNPNDIRLFFGK